MVSKIYFKRLTPIYFLCSSSVCRAFLFLFGTDPVKYLISQFEASVVVVVSIRHTKLEKMKIKSHLFLCRLFRINKHCCICWGMVDRFSIKRTDQVNTANASFNMVLLSKSVFSTRSCPIHAHTYVSFMSYLMLVFFF